MGGLVNHCLNAKEDRNRNEISLERRPTESNAEMSARKIISFKDFKGFKKVADISKIYEFREVLGKGSFGQVKKALHLKAEVVCAIKIIKKRQVQEHQILMDLMQNELKVLEETTHPNILRIFELLEDEYHYYIVSELIEGGELYNRILALKHMNESSAAKILHQVLLAVNYMHQRRITHRDIKPENILMESTDPNSLALKITDFGFAAVYDPQKGLNDVLGSPLYMAPEIMAQDYYDAKVDIWAIGVIGYILLSGKPPYKGKTKEEIYKSIKSQPLSFNHRVFSKVSGEAKDFITQALQISASKRPTALELLEHPWLEKNLDVNRVDNQVQLDIAKNLEEFTAITNFQSGVLSFIVGLKSTSQELEELNRMFLMLDTSKDGILSVQEIEQGLDSVLATMKGDVKDYMELMKAMDRDGNGVIDYQEFITAAIDKMTLINQESLTQAFKIIDKDASGMITVDELKAAFDTQGTKKDQELWQEIMAEVDQNNDNMISLEEFMASMTAFLKKEVAGKMRR